MQESNIERIYKDISLLEISEKFVLLSKLFTDISISYRDHKQNNIYDIKGVGKELWEGMDAQLYVNKERESWE